MITITTLPTNNSTEELLQPNIIMVALPVPLPVSLNQKLSRGLQVLRALTPILWRLCLIPLPSLH